MNAEASTPTQKRDREKTEAKNKMVCYWAGECKCFTCWHRKQNGYTAAKMKFASSVDSIKLIFIFIVANIFIFRWKTLLIRCTVMTMIQTIVFFSLWFFFCLRKIRETIMYLNKTKSDVTRKIQNNILKSLRFRSVGFNHEKKSWQSIKYHKICKEKKFIALMCWPLASHQWPMTISGIKFNGKVCENLPI